MGILIVLMLNVPYISATV